MFVKLIRLALILALVTPFAAQALEREALLPPETSVSVRISSTTNFWSQLKLSSMGRLWNDPQFQDFLGHPSFDDWKTQMLEEDKTGSSELWLEELKMLTGEVVFGATEKLQDHYIVAQMTAEDFDRSLGMDEQMKERSETPFDIKKSTFQGVMMLQHIENGGTAAESSTWQAHYGNTLVIGPEREWVERSIVRMKKDTIKEPVGDPRLDVELPVAELIRSRVLAGIKPRTNGQPAPMNMEAFFDALGLLGIEKYTFTLVLKEAEMMADSNLKVSDLTKGIFSLLDTTPSPLPMVSFIPKGISSLEVGRFNLLRFWRELPAILGSVSPVMKPQFDMIPALILQNTGINLEQDLFANMDSKYISFSTSGRNQAISAVAVELKDAIAFKNGLETALNAPALQQQVNQLLNIDEFLEQTLYEIKTSDPQQQRMAFTVSGDYLVYGETDGVRLVLRAQNNEGAANPAFARSELVKGIRQHVPGGAFAYNAVDWKKNMDRIVRTFNKPEYIRAFRQGWINSSNGIPPPDFGKLPPASHIASFFNTSYTYTEAVEDGLHQKTVLKY
ncbi:MAG: hypothetical protein K9M45_02645 [Kiritimatiellales bacterium]|nr:hypothetical protein [Kiritimatiellales bacterium]